MAKKADIVSITGASGNHVPINTNFEAINTKLDNTLSLDGSVPNALNADLDLNGNDLLNVGNLVTMFWRGEFDDTISYKVNDGVLYNGSSYVCIKNSFGILPTDETYWDDFAQKGDTGDTGDAGVSATIHDGFADYNDSSTASTPVTLVEDVWTTLPNDGLGSFTQEQLPPGLGTLLGSGGSLDLTGLQVGSDLLVRPDFTVTPSSNNSALAFRFSLGNGDGAYTLEQQLGRLDLGAGIPYRFALQALYIYVGDLNTRDNPVNLQIKLSGAGSVVNAGMAVKVYSK